jgi:hypothetical protein
MICTPSKDRQRFRMEISVDGGSDDTFYFIAAPNVGRVRGTARTGLLVVSTASPSLLNLLLMRLVVGTASALS